MSKKTAWPHSFLVLLWLFACLFQLIIAPQELAAQKNSYFEQGKIYFQNKDYQQAYDHFSRAFEIDPASLDISFYLGRAAFEIGDYEMAIMAYDRILIMEPDSQRVKLEIARCHLALNSYESARRYFNDVKATNPPEAVRTNIDNFLTLIEKSQQKHFLSGMISTGMNWDDNIRSAPVDSIFNGLPLTGDSASPEEDLIYTSIVNLTHIYRVPNSDIGWKTSILNYNALYDDVHSLDVNFYSISSGIILQSGNSLLDLHGSYNYMDYEHDKYFKSYGLESSININPNRFLLVAGGFKVEQKEFHTDPDRDAVNVSIQFSPTLINGVHRTSAVVIAAHEGAENDVFTYDRWSGTLRYDCRVSSRIGIFLCWLHEDTNYEDEWNNEKRDDVLNDYSGGFIARVWQSKDRKLTLTAHIKHTYSNQDSTVSLYEYHRNVTAGTFNLFF